MNLIEWDEVEKINKKRFCLSHCQTHAQQVFEVH